jgi:hypothetical protein
MATTYKVLGQSAPAATTAADLYTVPAATEAIVSTITVANRGATAGTYRVYARKAGASVANAQYLIYDASLSATSTDTMTLGITLAATDVISVYASNANFSFNAFGTELS